MDEIITLSSAIAISACAFAVKPALVAQMRARGQRAPRGDTNRAKRGGAVSVGEYPSSSEPSASTDTASAESGSSGSRSSVSYNSGQDARFQSSSSDSSDSSDSPNSPNSPGSSKHSGNLDIDNVAAGEGEDVGLERTFLSQQDREQEDVAEREASDSLGSWKEVDDEKDEAHDSALAVQMKVDPANISVGKRVRNKPDMYTPAGEEQRQRDLIQSQVQSQVQRRAHLDVRGANHHLPRRLAAEDANKRLRRDMPPNTIAEKLMRDARTLELEQRGRKAAPPGQTIPSITITSLDNDTLVLLCTEINEMVDANAGVQSWTVSELSAWLRSRRIRVSESLLIKYLDEVETIKMLPDQTPKIMYDTGDARIHRDE
jgi:hypothetical protein